MPPFRNGLKRKSGAVKSDEKLSAGAVVESTDSEEENEELFRGELDAGGDSTDSEHGDDDAAESDHERDGVLFDDADSTLGDEEQFADASDGSSELTDSEADESEGGEDEEESSQDDEESVDSGAESGPGPSTSDASDTDRKHTVHTKHKRKNVIQNSDKENLKSNVDKLAETIEKASMGSQPVVEKDEYESGDTSDEEDRRNTVGDVPMWWYNEYPHIGYDLDGKRIMKPPQRDQIDEFLKKCEDPAFWRTVRDPGTGQDVVLSAADLELIRRLRQGHVPDPDHQEYQPWVEWFSREVLATPVRAFPEHKRSFLPSDSERRQLARLVHALKMGWTKTRRQLAAERRDRREKKFYNLWGSSTSSEEERLRGVHKHIAAPRRPPPAHAESYNPPPEYLLDDKELKEWNKLSETPWKRKYTFLPTRFASLRQVPAYERLIRERFLRCLDLYLAPRAIKMRLTISPEDLVPKLPSPRDLQPFPTSEALVFRGHRGLVRSADFDPSGQYVVSGGDDGTVRVWETSSGRCLRTIQLEEPVARVAWGPARGLGVLAAAAGARLLLLSPGAGVGALRVARRTDALLDEPPQHGAHTDARTLAAARWERPAPEEWARGVRAAVLHFKPLAHVSWHARGDYVCATVRDGAARAVLVHQLSRRRSQLPLARAKGLVQCAVFHPTKPQLFVATQRVVRVYDLVKQELVRKLLTGAQWISGLALHPAGDNLLVTSYDRKCIWFDLELSSSPYQTLRVHGGAVRAAAFHARYPLFATAGDDPHVVVSHGMVYNDLLQNPLLVPLKQLAAGGGAGGLRVLELRWHPAQPWLLAACADAALRLYS